MSKDEDNVIVSASKYGYENEDLTVPDEDKETNSLQKPFDPKKNKCYTQFHLHV